MKKLLAPALTALALVAPSLASAQAFGQFTAADPVPLNGHLFGAYLNTSQNIIGLTAQLRLSFYPNVDFGFQGGLTRIDLSGTDVTTVRVGGDVRFLAAQESESFPVDLAVGGALGVETGDKVSILALGPTAVVSRKLPMGGSAQFVPFVGSGLLFTRLNITDGLDENNIVVPLRLGGELRFSTDFRGLVELDIPINDDFNDNLSLLIGVNLPF